MFERLSKFALLAIFLLTCTAAFLSSQLGFDYNFENFFPENDEETEYYKYFREQFQTDNDFLVIGLVNEEGVFDQDFLEKTDSLTQVLKTVPDITTVTSPTELQEIIRDPLLGQVFERPLLRLDQPEYYPADSTRIYDNGEFVGSFFSKDGKALLIQARHTEFLSKEGCDTLAFNVQEVLRNSGFPEYHVVGRSIGQEYYVNLMQTELMIFVSISIVLVIIFLIIAFRSFWGVWVPITVVLLSIIWTLGLMQITGKKVDLMLTILPTILFVVGVSDVVHIISRFFEAMREGMTKLEAIKITFKEIGLATLLTSVTTGIGFLTLLTSSIRPLSEFGLYTAAGVFIAFILAYTLLPAVLVLSRPPKVVEKAPQKIFWNRRLLRAFMWTINNRILIFVISIVIAAVSIWGITKVEVNNFILEDLKDGDPLKEEFGFFEEKFAGARPFELSLKLKNDSLSFFDREILLEMEKVDEYLMNEYGVGDVISPVRIIKTAWRTWKGGNNRFYEIPPQQKNIDRLVRLFSNSQFQEFSSFYLNEKEKLARVSGKLDDLGSLVFIEKDKEFMKWASENIDPSLLELRVTGTAKLIDSNNKYLATNMINGLIIAFLVIALIAGIMFRSLKMIIIALIPNIFPLIMIGGIMGLSGIYLKVSTSIIFTIAFGIAVDDTIHFLSKFRLQLGAGKPLLYALKRTYISTGKAIIVTSIILCGGFLTLISSDFLGTYYVGLLISLTLLFAVIADLFLLPVLILFFYRKPKRR